MSRLVSAANVVVFGIAVCALACLVFRPFDLGMNGPTEDKAPASIIVEQDIPAAIRDAASPVEAAYRHRVSNTQVIGVGTVVRLLPDDNDGRPHQRFILKLESGQTVLIAHNIALAPRIDDLEKADTVNFFGEYEWNSQGGVIHWTHHDPDGRHVSGWLKHGDRMYQ